MAWKTVSKGEFWVVKSEKHTVSSTTDKDSTSFTVPPGQDFVVGVYHASTASDAVDIDMLWSFDDSTFTVGKADLKADHGPASATSAFNYDISANGEAPFYKVRIDPDTSGVSDTTMAYTLYVGFHRRKLGKDY